MSELISLLLPVWNEEKRIKDCLQSCLSQSYSDIEVIIVDNHSTDDTVNIIKNFSDKRIKLYINDRNLGALKNHELAFQYSIGKYVKYVGADDIVYPDGIKVLYDELKSGQSIGACGIIDDILDDGEIRPIAKRCRVGIINFKSHLWRPNPFYIFSLFHRENMLSGFPFKPIFSNGTGADLVFLATMLTKGSLSVINHPVFAYRNKDRSALIYSTSSILNRLNMLRQNTIYLVKIIKIINSSTRNPFKRISNYALSMLGFLKNNI